MLVVLTVSRFESSLAPPCVNTKSVFQPRQRPLNIIPSLASLRSIHNHGSGCLICTCILYKLFCYCQSLNFCCCCCCCCCGFLRLKLLLCVCRLFSKTDKLRQTYVRQPLPPPHTVSTRSIYNARGVVKICHHHYCLDNFLSVVPNWLEMS